MRWNELLRPSSLLYRSPVSYFWLLSGSTPKFSPIFPIPCPPLPLLQDPGKNARCSEITEFLIRNVQTCGSSRSSWKESVRSSFGKTFMGKAIWENPIAAWLEENSKLWMPSRTLWKRVILICVRGWLKNGWKETKSWSDVERPVTNAWIDWFHTLIIHVNTNNIVMWVILLNSADWDCWKTPISREILKIQNPLLEEHCAFLEVIHLVQ